MSKRKASSGWIVLKNISDMHLVVVMVVLLIGVGEIRAQESQQINTCLFEPVRGPCQGLIRRYFYNPVVNECREFFYSGCGGNANNYLTKLSCEASCSRPRSIGVATSPQPIDCTLPINGGPCRGYFLRWAFNGVSCQQFTYGGCGGNWNRFETSDDCETTCGISQAVIANPLIVEPENRVLPPAPPVDLMQTGATLGPLCTWPLNPGPCRAYFPKWGFQSGRCVEFMYGGCGGNSNRFDSLQECQQRCNTDTQSAAVQNQVQQVSAWCPQIQQQAPPLGCEIQPVTKPDGCPGYEIRCYEGACASNPCTAPCEYCVNDPVLCPPGSLCLGYRCLLRDGCPGPLGTNRRRSIKAVFDDPAASPCSTTHCPNGQQCHDKRGSAVCLPLDHSVSQAEQQSGACLCGPCQYCINGGQEQSCQNNQTCIMDQCAKLGCTKDEICELIEGRFTCFGNDHICHQAPDPGSCSDQFQQFYFYNWTSARCQLFSYSGCGGNKNRFKTDEQCKKRCAHNL